MSNDQKPLKVLNASAGSGKTYNLVREYLLILIGESADTSRFAKILAMTFTNKAAIEMKNRIVQKLDELSYPDKFGKSSEEYATDLSKILGISPIEVHERARMSLKGILHRYEDFHVMTIDKFNLKLIRSFSRDLDLPAEFDVILNESEVIEQVVDMLMSQLGKKDLESLTDLMIAYAKDNIEEGERWDFRDQLIDFGSILAKEKDQPLINKLMEMDFSSQRRKDLRSLLGDQEQHFLSQCKDVYDLYIRLAIPEKNFPGMSKTTKPIEKLAEVDSFPTKLFTPTIIDYATNATPAGREFPDELKRSILSLQNSFETLLPSITVGKAFLKNFYNMALLQYMARSLDTVKRDEQLIRISEFNKLISSLVRDEKAPFIYERLGTRFKNFLLDEFQDTSRLQWLNMVPLVHESLSNNQKNLIVGDPKQSIYRFKNGVAEQFVALPAIYNPEKDPTTTSNSAFFNQMGMVSPLMENYRSSEVVVNFNNTFFEQLKTKLAPTTQEFYASIRQNPMSTKAGYVQITSQETPLGDEELVPLIIEKIEECKAKGFNYGDICILSDTNFRANKWAMGLTNEKYKVVSAESLLVQNEVKVKLILSYLKRRLNPSVQSEKKKFAELYFRLNNLGTFDTYRSYMSTFKDASGRDRTYFDDERFIKDFFGDNASFFYKYETLYDLVQSFYQIMNWDELKNPYLHHFADFAHEFEQSKGPDLKNFLDHYNAQKHRLAIQLPESDDAVKIMTIHKSKGLEFPVVILPFLNFDTGIRPGTRFLIEIDDYILYSTLSGTSSMEGIRTMNHFELGQILTDKVNQCYVGFTRPEQRLYVFNYFQGKKFGRLAHETFKKMNDDIEDANGRIVFESGDQNALAVVGKSSGSNFFNPTTQTEHLWFPDISIMDKGLPDEDDKLSKEQRLGNQFHIAVSKIHNQNEIEAVLNALCAEGQIEAELQNQLQLDIEQLLSSEIYNGMLNGAKEILSEQSIILGRDSLKRPDKIIFKDGETIVIDFKTGTRKEKDFDQLQEYVLTLQEMELPAVRGFLYYTQSKEMIGLN
jgi:ATP-dependent exoDNAse (exonuclease V) beta subunit